MGELSGKVQPTQRSGETEQILVGELKKVKDFKFWVE